MKYNKIDIPTYYFDIVIIGAGGAGMQAALKLSNKNFKVAVLSKVFPTRSHTVAAQGGIGASLGNISEDYWYWHMYDTIKGSDYLGDQNAIEFMCQEAPKVIYELENFGMPFDRNINGTIYQRTFGGHTSHLGKKSIHRSCAVADRTGHALLHTLYQRNILAKTKFFSEWFCLDILYDNTENIALGVIALNIKNNKIVIFRSKNTILATGGSGRIWKSSTNAFINTGDGLGMIARLGLPLQDMEFWQFHPTGLYKSGILISEAVRGEGGILINNKNERFMEKYAPNLKDLAPRDFISRCIDQEIKEGRGVGKKKDHIYLSLKNINNKIINNRLPSILEIVKKFLEIDATKTPIPIIPTIHYQMGGISTNIYGQVLKPNLKLIFQNEVQNLFAIGECACISVHGANRLGTNSLLDLLVFGNSLSNFIIKRKNEKNYKNLSKETIDFTLNRLNRLENNKGNEKVHNINNKIRSIMQKYCGVFRTNKLLKKGLKKITNLDIKKKFISIKDKSNIFNIERIEALELDNLIEVAKATIFSANHRKESRGAHSNKNYNFRDDKNWLKHTLWFSENNNINYKPVNIKPLIVKNFKPKVRKY